MGTISYDEARTHFSELLDQEKASRAWHQSLSLGSGTRGRCSHVEALNIARCPPEESIVGVVLVQVANVHPRVGGAFHQSRGRSRRSGAREARFRGSQAAHQPRTAELPHHPRCQDWRGKPGRTDGPTRGRGGRCRPAGACCHRRCGGPTREPTARPSGPAPQAPRGSRSPPTARRARNPAAVACVRWAWNRNHQGGLGGRWSGRKRRWPDYPSLRHK